MARKKPTYKSTSGENFVPARPYFANCVKVGCGLGYTAKKKDQAGFHCMCGAVMTWNDPANKKEPTFVSRDK